MTALEVRKVHNEHPLSISFCSTSKVQIRVFLLVWGFLSEDAHLAPSMKYGRL